MMDGKYTHNNGTEDKVRSAAEIEEMRARISRLEDALDHITRVGLGSRNPTARVRLMTERARSALNGDSKWMTLPRPKTYHDALERGQQGSPA